MRPWPNIKGALCLQSSLPHSANLVLSSIMDYIVCDKWTREFLEVLHWLTWMKRWIRVGSHGVPNPKSQVPYMLTSPNIQARFHLLSLMKPFKNYMIDIHWFVYLDFFIQMFFWRLVLWVGFGFFFTQRLKQEPSLNSRKCYHVDIHVILETYIGATPKTLAALVIKNISPMYSPEIQGWDRFQLARVTGVARRRGVALQPAAPTNWNPSLVNTILNIMGL